MSQSWRGKILYQWCFTAYWPCLQEIAITKSICCTMRSKRLYRICRTLKRRKSASNKIVEDFNKSREKRLHEQHGNNLEHQFQQLQEHLKEGNPIDDFFNENRQLFHHELPPMLENEAIQDGKHRNKERQLHAIHTWMRVNRESEMKVERKEFRRKQKENVQN